MTTLNNICSGTVDIIIILNKFWQMNFQQQFRSLERKPNYYYTSKMSRLFKVAITITSKCIYIGI
jgi:hypothetical protein